jgi:hypothetical protein
MLGLKRERPVKAKLELDLQKLLSQQSVICRYSEFYASNDVGIDHIEPKTAAAMQE